MHEGGGGGGRGKTSALVTERPRSQGRLLSREPNEQRVRVATMLGRLIPSQDEVSVGKNRTAHFNSQ